MTADERVLPVITDDGRPFWEACGRGELVCQRCDSCGRYRFPPMSVCPDCRNAQYTWVKLSGRGRVYSWSVTRVPRLECTPPVVFRGFEDRLPYVIVVVELAEQEGLRMLSNLVEIEPEKITLDLPVEVLFDRVTPEIAIPQFRPSGQGR